MAQFEPAFEELGKLVEDLGKRAVLLSGGDHRKLIGAKAAATRFERRRQRLPGGNTLRTVLHDLSDRRLGPAFGEDAQGLVDRDLGLEKHRQIAGERHPPGELKPSRKSLTDCFAEAEAG